MTAPSKLAFDGFALDIAKRELRHGQALVPLEPQVFDLLVYVIRNRERVVSKDDLVEAVWGGRIVSDSTLTTRINAMRKALGDSGEEQRLIRTVARKGIRFVGAVIEGEMDASAHQVAEHLPSDRSALPLPDKSSIAVLPFQNMSGDPEQEYFADGMVEEIITALSRFHWLFVIARNSSFTYKGRAVDVKQAARELGVRYVLQGSVRKAGQTVRITGQLIDATTGAHLWADKFDGDLANVFELQDKVAVSVVGTIEPKLKSAEVARARRKTPESLDAYDLYLQALPALESITAEGCREAIRLLQLAIAKDPGFALAKAKAASCYSQRLNSGWTEDLASERAEAIRLVRSALAQDKDDAEILTYAATVIARFGYDKGEALVLIDRALSMNENLAEAWGYSAYLRNTVGDVQTGLAHGERALRLNPYGPRSFFYLGTIGVSHLFAGRTELAVEWLARSSKEQPNFPSTFGFLSAALAHLGRIDEARSAIARRLEMEPSLTITSLSKRMTYQPAQARLYLDGLRLAGLPE
jgi:TolB-like protein/tetratricopeptide (TPR) repeat protein